MLVIITPTWNYRKFEIDRSKWLELTSFRWTRCVAVGHDVPFTADYVVHLSEKGGVLESMSKGAEFAMVGNPDYVGFIHDDVELQEEGWDYQVVKFFEDNPKVGLVGFGGATRLGAPSLYKVPYKLQQLARYNFLSNMQDAEVHGVRTKIATKVVVLDGFSLIFRRAAYEEMGGWESAISGGYPPHHMYDAYACCMMRRLNWETWMLPVRCHHRGGETAVSDEYSKWLKERGYSNDSEVHSKAHILIYQDFRDVLPMEV